MAFVVSEPVQAFYLLSCLALVFRIFRPNAWLDFTVLGFISSILVIGMILANMKALPLVWHVSLSIWNTKPIKGIPQCAKLMLDYSCDFFVPTLTTSCSRPLPSVRQLYSSLWSHSHVPLSLSATSMGTNRTPRTLPTLIQADSVWLRVFSTKASLSCERLLVASLLPMECPLQAGLFSPLGARIAVSREKLSRMSHTRYGAEFWLGTRSGFTW